MNLENQINIMVKKAILDEIDNLAIKAVVREHIENAISKNEIVQKLDKIIDSYFRSAMNNQDVELFIRNKMNYMAETEIRKQIDKIIGSYSRWEGSATVKNALELEIKRQFLNGFNVSVDVQRKER